MEKIIRLKKRKDFVRISNQGYKFVSHGMILQAGIGANPDGIRLGFTVTKKLGCAVIRNRIRRRLREVCRLELSDCAVPGYDYVLIGRKATFDRPFDQLLGDLKYLMRQLEKRLAEKNAGTEVAHEAE